MYTRAQVSQHFQTTTETIRRWSKDFAQYLSDAANDSNKAVYSDEDMRVLSYVHEAYRSNESTDVIAVSLASGQRGAWDGELQNTSYTVTENQLAQVQAIIQERDNLRNELEETKRLLAVAQSQAEAGKVSQEEIRNLHKAIGRLEAFLIMNGIDPTTGKPS